MMFGWAFNLIFYEYIKKFHKNLEKRKLIYENI